MEEDRSEKLEKKRDPGKTIEVLYQISEAVGSTRNLDDLYKVIHQSLNGIFDEDNFPIALDDEQKSLVTFPYPVEDKEDLMLLNTVSRHIGLAIERKESKERLAEQRAMLEKILESLPVGLALVQDRVFKWVNNEMVPLFGYESKLEFENQSTRMIYSNDEDFERFGKKIFNDLSLGGTVDYDLYLVKKDETLFPVHIRLNSSDDKNPMAWTIATFTDISQRKAIEKEKFEKERLQGVLEMAGAVCHEINQPLQAILGYSELLLMGPEDRGIEKSHVNSIKSQAKRLDEIIRKLSGITHYRTVDYPGNTKIIDIWGTGNNSDTDGSGL